MDSTEWKIGQYPLHVLVLAANVKGIAVPVYFRIYTHKGVLSEKERIGFIRKSLSVIDLRDKLLIADREFIGKDWFDFLSKNRIDFLIRLRKGIYQQWVDLECKQYEKLQKRALKKAYAQAQFTLEKQPYRLEVYRNENQSEKEPLLYLLTNRLKEKRTGKQYGKRWKIEYCFKHLNEYCFKHLKTNGFNLQQVAFQDTNKIRLLISFVIVAYILAIEQGILQEKQNPVRHIRFANGKKYRSVSIFRDGLQKLKEKLTYLVDFRTYLFKLTPKETTILKIV
ncbi:transposase [Xanthocytophaga flava]|uniref:transposase n=1 Tax=Xanthocytophaga flava TaxID=3048013 RepID=UPI0028D4E07C|nr:transposase [Xanthocytophaga flavus]MDJ1472030.1 transposase [Xanthocytophaga flavus]